jgi:hypothetical protein
MENRENMSTVLASRQVRLVVMAVAVLAVAVDTQVVDEEFLNLVKEAIPSGLVTEDRQAPTLQIHSQA